jgi:excisionase family DNA binding protein
MKTNEEKTQSFLTTREACNRLGYSRPDSFLRAWRGAGLPEYRRPGGHCLVDREDLSRFVRRDHSHASDHQPNLSKLS